ncbi:melatonin receptor type 1A-like [Oculina patagonica]
MEQIIDDTRSLPKAAIQTIVSSVTTLLSLLGNALVCIAFYRNRRLRTITNFYVLSLAVIDVTMATFHLPFQAIASGLRRWPFGFKMCQFTGFFVQYWAQISLCILALASINRYVCVVKPDRYPVFFTKKKTITSILVVWIVLFVQNLILVFAIPVVYQWHPNTLYCQATSLDERIERVTYVFYGCFFVFLMLIVVFCYCSVYRVVRHHNAVVVPSLQRLENCPGTGRAQEMKTSRVLFATVLGFSVCWSPLIVTFFLTFGFQVSIPSSAHSIYPIFSTFSAWINPIIYGVMNRAMRKEFRNILFCRKEE